MFNFLLNFHRRKLSSKFSNFGNWIHWLPDFPDSDLNPPTGWQVTLASSLSSFHFAKDWGGQKDTRPGKRYWLSVYSYRIPLILPHRTQVIIDHIFHKSTTNGNRSCWIDSLYMLWGWSSTGFVGFSPKLAITWSMKGFWRAGYWRICSAQGGCQKNSGRASKKFRINFSTKKVSGFDPHSMLA